MKYICDCCEGPEKLTPRAIVNRHGLDKLVYRAGTHSEFLETMKSSLTDFHIEIPTEEVGSWQLQIGNLRDPVSLVTKLRDGEDQLSRYIKSYLSYNLDDYDEYEVSDELQNELIDVINNLLKDPTFYDKERFSHVVLDKEIISLMDQELDGEELVRLNRLLLEKAYQREIIKAQWIYPLRGLTTRESDDFSISMLDSWATVADVITFYQERIANEGFLRTATERRSVLELAKLVGYLPRPGVSSSVYLAFTLEKGYDVEIPAGTKAQSLPQKLDEMPQVFETSVPLEGRAEWSELKPRLTIPQLITEDMFEGDGTITVYFQGTQTNLEPNDLILLNFEGEDGELSKKVVRVLKVEVQAEEKRTKVTVVLFQEVE